MCSEDLMVGVHEYGWRSQSHRTQTELILKIVLVDHLFLVSFLY